MKIFAAIAFALIAFSFLAFAAGVQTQVATAEPTIQVNPTLAIAFPAKAPTTSTGLFTQNSNPLVGGVIAVAFVIAIALYARNTKHYSG